MGKRYNFFRKSMAQRTGKDGVAVGGCWSALAPITQFERQFWNRSRQIFVKQQQKFVEQFVKKMQACSKDLRNTCGGSQSLLSAEKAGVK